jgi:hypothetical protein
VVGGVRNSDGGCNSPPCARDGFSSLSFSRRISVDDDDDDDDEIDLRRDSRTADKKLHGTLIWANIKPLLTIEHTLTSLLSLV